MYRRLQESVADPLTPTDHQIDATDHQRINLLAELSRMEQN